MCTKYIIFKFIYNPCWNAIQMLCFPKVNMLWQIQHMFSFGIS
uniref:Uncharacterized protein n=1 Tax=Anguilla anguilla TaxID=7936 RepID=A0A0E9T0G5_ANGAN